MLGSPILKPPESSPVGVTTIPGLTDRSNEPYFHAPWQAKLFALTLSLQERGLFSWQDWSERLSRQLRMDANISSDASEAEHATHYYMAWMRTLEAFLEQAGMAENVMIEEMAKTWKRAAQATPHGQPIVFENGLDAS